MAEAVADRLEMALTYLLKHQNADGGWGYLASHPSMVEATAVTVIALAASHPDSEATEKALRWLQLSQHTDGGWGMSALDSESTWQTAWALLALNQSSASLDTTERGNRWLLEVAQMTIPDEISQDMREMLSIDFSLQGWPWFPGEANWVEPTALSLLALAPTRNLGARAERIESGIQYLWDRRCQAGGWNVGNPAMLGATMPARAVPTTFALLALALLAPDSIREADLKALRRDMHVDGGALAAACGLIALRQLRQGVEGATASLQKRQLKDGSWNQNVLHTALALIAIRDPFCGLWERCSS